MYQEKINESETEEASHGIKSIKLGVLYILDDAGGYILYELKREGARERGESGGVNMGVAGITRVCMRREMSVRKLGYGDLESDSEKNQVYRRGSASLSYEEAHWTD